MVSDDILFFFNETATTEIYTLSLHDALPIYDDGSLNAIRNELAANFNGYAAGEMLFGPQIGPTTAEPNTYRITLTVDGQSYEGSVTIRDDPLATKHGGR